MADTKNFPTAMLVKKKVVAPEHFILWFKPAEPFSFKPGQYLTLGKEGIERPYSIVSEPSEPLVELYLEVIPPKFRSDKSISPKLYAMKEGEMVTFRPSAKGTFLLDETIETHIMIATVTGIAPFISMIRAYQKGYYKGVPKKIYVFQGASYFDELGYFEELKSAAEAGSIIYIPTVSRPQEARNASWQGERGRVNLILDKYFEKFKITLEKSVVYLCGNSQMIDYLGNKREKPDKPLGKLVQAGFKVKEEIFW